MKNSAVLTVLAQLSEQPFWVGRELLREKAALLQAAGLPDLGRFRPPPLPSVFGPGTAFPAGVAAVVARRARD